MSALTYAPLPTVRDLVSASFGRVPSDRDLAQPWLRSPGELPRWFSRTAWSLRMLAELREALTGERPCLFVPDYFCASSLRPARAAGISVRFYPLLESLEPDYDSCAQLLSAAEPALFVLVHFFGAPANATRAAAFVASRNAWLVEDAAHVFLPSSGIGEAGDAVVYSPHKLFAIPDGGLLVVRPGAGRLKQFEPGRVEKALDHAIGQLPPRPATTLPWAARRMFQRCVPRVADLLSRSRGQRFDDDGAGATPESGDPRMSELARRLLASSIPRLNLEEHLRATSAALLQHVSPGSVRTAVTAPYLVDVACPNPDSARARFGELTRSRVPVLSWPDLADEVKSASGIHSVAVQRRSTHLFLAAHQSLDHRHLMRALRIHTPKPPRVELRAFTDGPARWSSFLRDGEQCAAQQSWTYGAAKAVDGWHAKRYVCLHKEEPIGIVQVLERTLLGASLRRVNRGPVLFSGVDSALRVGALAAVARLGRWSRGSILSFAPDAERSGEVVTALASLGLKSIRRAPWRSAWLDLRPSVDRLRAGLLARWSGPLRSAERGGLEVEISSSAATLSWALEQHERHRITADFDAPTPRFLARLATTDGEQSIFVARVSSGDVADAFVVVMHHGSAATYLIGWTSERGRVSRAGHLALWSALIECRARGTEWFDLGGVDERNTPGIARFKLGLGCTPYTLVGEFLAL